MSGLGGTDCTICISKLADWTSPEFISDGSRINRCAEDTLKLYEGLVDANGVVSAKSGDFETWQGVTAKPISVPDQTSITLTHGYINGTMVPQSYISLSHRLSIMD